MSAATPVLEREVTVRENAPSESAFGRAAFNADERHNAQIGSVYARLINPESTVEDVIGESASVHFTEQSEKRSAPEPYLVRNARADSDLFRADSNINRAAAVAAVVDETEEEEENEDLRPTQTTIQYKTAAAKADEQSRVENAAAKPRLTKKEKITIAVVVTVIVALFVLIIVNSAIISSLNSDLSVLQSSLATARASYSGVSDEVNEYLGNIGSAVEDYAFRSGMTGN